MIYREGPPAPGLPLRREHVGLHIAGVCASAVVALVLTAFVATALDGRPAWATNATFVLCGFGVVSLLIIALGAARMLRGHPMPAGALVVVALLPYLVGWWAIGTLGPRAPATVAEAATRMVERSAHQGLADLFTAGAFVVVAFASFANVNVVVPPKARARGVTVAAAIAVAGLVAVRVGTFRQAPPLVQLATLVVAIGLLVLGARAGQKLPAMIDWHDVREADVIVSSAIVGVVATGAAVVLFDDAIAAFGDLRLSVLATPPTELDAPDPVPSVTRAAGHAARVRSFVACGVLFGGLLVAVVAASAGRRADGTRQPPWRFGAILPLVMLAFVTWLGVVEHQRGWANLVQTASKDSAFTIARTKGIALPMVTAKSALVRTTSMRRVRVVVDSAGDPSLVPSPGAGLEIVDARAPIGAVSAMREPGRRGIDLVLAGPEPPDPSLGALAPLVAPPPRTFSLGLGFGPLGVTPGEGHLTAELVGNELRFTHPRLEGVVTAPSPMAATAIDRVLRALAAVGQVSEIALVVPKTMPTQRVIDRMIDLYAWLSPMFDPPRWAAPIVVVAVGG